MSENKKVTYEQYKVALDEKIRIEKYLEHLTSITRAYMYQVESERIVNRKLDSEKLHNEIN